MWLFREKPEALPLEVLSQAFDAISRRQDGHEDIHQQHGNGRRLMTEEDELSIKHQDDTKTVAAQADAAQYEALVSLPRQRPLVQPQLHHRPLYGIG
jgi:hypothetical protein